MVVVSSILEAVVLVSFATIVLTGTVSDDTTVSGLNLCADIDRNIYSGKMTALETVLALVSSEEVFAFA